MRTNRLFLLLIVVFTYETFGKELYLITTPNVLLSDAVHKFNVYVSTDASLVIETIHVASNITNKSDVIVLKKGYQSISYFLPFIGKHVGSTIKLRFLGDKCPCQPLTVVKGNFINETRSIDILMDNFIIFSETDKPIYKPGDVVKLRAMAIYSTNLMLNPPISGPFIEILKDNKTYSSVAAIQKQKTNFDSVTIETPDNVKMAQWTNVSFEKAMKMSFNLSKDPVFGNWKITLTLGTKKEITLFIVKKYVLPRFVVDIYPPAALLVSETNTTVKVCATYSTGKNLQALIRGRLCLIGCREFVSSLDGKTKCTNITLSDSLFGIKNRKTIYYIQSNVTVTVQESGTTHEVTKKASLPNIRREPYEIKFKSRTYFKPGLPYFGKLILLQFNGSPKQKTRVLITVDSSFLESWGFQKNYTSNEAGIVNFVIPYIPVSSWLNLAITGDSGSSDSGINEPRYYISLSNWESVSNEYLQISPLKKVKKCPGTVQLSLLMNADVSSVVLYAQMFSRGLITKFLDFPPVPVKCSDRDDDHGHYKCHDNNKLKCLKGWTGDNCREPVCEGGCNKGACIKPGRCSCKQGWIGQSCKTCVPASYCVNGYCEMGLDCRCHPGWTGYRCDTVGPKVHAYNKTVTIPMTTKAPKPMSEYEKLTIFERVIEISLEKNVGPDLHLLVYYINQDNEVVADSIEISKGLTNCSHAGRGQFKFNKKTAMPGELIKLTLDPGSGQRSCALRISDVALSQFGQASNINLGYLVNKLIELNHRITKDQRFVSGQDVCLKGRSKRRAMYLPWIGQGYDSRKAFSQAGFTAITNARIVNAKCRTMYARGGNVMYDGAPATQRRMKAGTLEKVAEEVKKQIREFFPETWIFDYYNVTPSRINLTVPDSMTTWKANSFCMTENGVWIPPSRYLNVILPFFADIYVPYSVKMGEQLQLPVKLFNYVDACYEIKAEIRVNNSEIKITGATSFTVCVCPKDVKTLSFNLKALIIGTLNITVHAKSQYSSFCSNNGDKQDKSVLLTDSIRRQLLVEPPGIASETTFSEIICNTNNEHNGVKSEFKIPNDIVPRSLRSYLMYNGDVMGQTFDNLDGLVRMPYGCGEQNMINFVPSISVLDYLTNTKITNSELKARAIQYINDGYRRQLKYKHDDGSYSAFGKSDKNGSTWLTAFVLKSFTDASKYVTISKTDLKESIQYLEKMQLTNGCFKENGKLLSSAMAGGLKNKGKTDESLLAAYVLISLKNVKMSKTTFNISKALVCVKSGVDDPKATAYRLALSGYALSLYDLKTAAPILERLNNLSSTKGRYRYWKSGLDSSESYGAINSGDIETTGYAVLALNNMKPLPYLSAIIYWLSSKQNSLGGYFSTQDTIVALKALSVFAEKIGSGSFKNVSVRVDIDDTRVREDLVSASDRMITRKVGLGSENITYISIATNGTGCVSLQVISLYNIEKMYSSKEEFKITVRSTLTNVNECNVVELKVCSSYLRQDRDSNMILITIDFPSGWELSTTEKAQLMKLVMSPLKRIDFLKNKLHLYYDSFSYSDTNGNDDDENSNNKRCVTMRLDQITKVTDLKPSFVRIVDYYKPEIYSDTSYEVPMATCKLTNNTDKPPRNVPCPKCVNDTDSAVSDFIETICPWTHTLLSLVEKDKRIFYESASSVYYEWNIKLASSNCSCLKTWSFIKKNYTVVTTNYLWVKDNLTLTNTSTLYPTNVLYKAYRSDLTNSCYAAANFGKLLTRLLPDFKNRTTVAVTCSACIVKSTVNYLVTNITEFVCSKQPSWTLKIYSVNNTTINGSLTNKDNKTMAVLATFPLSTCFCLHQVKKMAEKSLQIIDLHSRLSIPEEATKKPLKIRLDENFEIVEDNLFTGYKFITCDKNKKKI